MNRNDNFSYTAKRELFDYLENQSEETGENIELDVIALCCEYQESTSADIIQDNRLDFNDDMDNEELAEVARDYLNDNTTIIGEFEDDAGVVSFVFACF